VRSQRQRPPTAPLFPYTTLFRSGGSPLPTPLVVLPRSKRNGPPPSRFPPHPGYRHPGRNRTPHFDPSDSRPQRLWSAAPPFCRRSEEHTSELQSRENLVCRLLLE